MSKKHWSTVVLDGSMTKKLLLDMIDHSHELVYQSLAAKIRLELQQSH